MWRIESKHFLPPAGEVSLGQKAISVSLVHNVIGKIVEYAFKFV